MPLPPPSKKETITTTTPNTWQLACLVELPHHGMQAGHLQHDAVRHILDLPHLHHNVALGLREGANQVKATYQRHG